MAQQTRTAVACMALLALLSIPALAQSSGSTVIVMGADGPTSIKWSGVELLTSGKFEVKAAEMKKPDGSLYAGSVASTGTTTDGTPNKVIRLYAWGSVSIKYVLAANKLTMAVTVNNTSSHTLQGLHLQLVVLKFPSIPSGWDGVTPHLGHNFGTPTVVPASFGTGQVTFCNEDTALPLLSGFMKASDPPAYKTYPVWACSSVFPGWAPLLKPVIVRPIAPGGTDKYTLSLVFSTAGKSPKDVAPGVFSSFSSSYPMKLSWPDRRPIGQLILSSSDMKIPGNPRGYFKSKEFDVTTTAGKAKFKEMLMAYADLSIKYLTEICPACGGAQGMIVWDIEGQEYPHAISYLGDPRSLPPEMEPVANEFFKKFKDKGFKTGICIRPQMPIRKAYTDGVTQIEVADPLANMIDKIAVAKARWGCTMFYVDSNGDPNVPIDATMFKKLAEAHPDVLLIPEHETPAYWAYTAPYGSTKNGFMGTPSDVRAMYPTAFSVIYGPDGPLVEKKAMYAKAVKEGDIMMFRAWFLDAETKKIEDILIEAKK